MESDCVNLFTVASCNPLFNTYVIKGATRLALTSTSEVFRVPLFEREGSFEAIKLKSLRTRLDHDRFAHELAMLRACHELGPAVTSGTVESGTGSYTGVICMEWIPCTLDVHIAQQKSTDALGSSFADGLDAILEALGRRRITHGDLALFNIGVTGSGRLLLLDFELSSLKTYEPAVDVYRLCGEFYSEFRSAGNAAFEDTKTEYIRRAWMPRWLERVGVSGSLKASQIESRWRAAYERYVDQLAPEIAAYRAKRGR
jgi:tRNA A-37 threonylcarbamoyl transferase component Bud32